MLDVVTIGSATLDIFLKSKDFKIDHRQGGVYLCEKYQSKIEAQELVMVSGGGATNNAVSFARQGFKVAPIIELGRDPAAEMILSGLTKEKVDLSFVVQEPAETTAVSVVLLSGQGGSIVTYRGASRQLTVSDIPFGKLGMQLKPGGWLHLTSVGGDMELVRKLLAWAKEKHRKVFWNPGNAELKKLSKDRVLQDPVFTGVTILQLNQTETQVLFGSQIPQIPDTTFIITKGKKGGEVHLPAKAGAKRQRTGYQSQTYSYRAARTKTLDSTGAGDAFGSGFVAALITGQDIRAAIEWGRRQSASVVKYIGAKEGLLKISNF